jgi:glycosyltransferase involved in cell wall biosynthesis
MTPLDSQSAFKEKKVCILVPTFNNEGTLRQVVDSLLPYTDQIIIVNDGSTDTTLDILKGYSNLHLLSYEKNRGKGWALRSGFAKALDLGFDYAITIDSDGQHFAYDLPKFLEKISETPDSIIVGARNMDQASVPGKSSFGNRFSNFWFWVTTGLTIPDTQSGYRLYPIRKIKDIHFLTRKFEFEIEVMVRSFWKGVSITTVPVKVFYAEKGVRVSHFRPFKDISRITLLNTFLVLIAVFYIHPRNFVRSLKKKN